MLFKVNNFIFDIYIVILRNAVLIIICIVNN